MGPGQTRPHLWMPGKQLDTVRTLFGVRFSLESCASCCLKGGGCPERGVFGPEGLGKNRGRP